ncbi:MAG TPA: copper oxidase [Phycisphaerales bacterium]|nr:copper oxidase [Phycisphaerales bacterium]HMP36165.1 copper oxidase [Phycisphaerales bacterium]
MAGSPLTRRALLLGGAALAGGTAIIAGGGSRRAAAAAPVRAARTEDRARPGEPGRDYRPVVTPNGWTLPWRVVDGAKVMHMVAEVVEHEFAPGLKATCWGYNGSVHGPTIEVVDGDRVRIFVTNRLPAATTVHWHGLIVPSGMDGVSGLSHAPIPPGETFMYEFTVGQHGTFMYHSHHAEMTQVALGMTGLFIAHPRPDSEAGRRPRPDRDYALLLHEWSIPVGQSSPDPTEMSDFNVLTINGRCFPGTAPLIAALGERVRIRMGNLSPMDHHPMHLHGYAFRVVGTDGGDIPESAQFPETTVLVPVGSTRTVELLADNPGDWAFHCHMTHHTMNQMAHGLPNMVGVDADGLPELIGRVLPGWMPMGLTGMGDESGDRAASSGGARNGAHARHGAHVRDDRDDLRGAPQAMPHVAGSIPMRGAPGPHGYIGMGGMFTIFKVRERLDGPAEAPDDPGWDPGWYQVPPGTQAVAATTEALRRNGIDPANTPVRAPVRAPVRPQPG